MAGTLWKLKRVMQYRGPGVYDVFDKDTECPELDINELTPVQKAEWVSFERRQRARDPNQRVIPVLLGGKPRYVKVGEDVELANPTPVVDATPAKPYRTAKRTSKEG